MKNISILGSTGSIGKSTLEVVRRSRQFRIIGLSAKSNIALLLEQVKEFNPQTVAVWDRDSADRLKKMAPKGLRIVTGMEGLCETAACRKNDLVVSSLVGSVGLIPTLAAIDAGIDIALANKEVLVMAGAIVMAKARAKGVKVLPVDSEHSAIFQCIGSGRKEEVRRIIITASGGPFVDLPQAKLRTVTVRETLNHPRWSMGRKVTVDSASLMNKGLEVIEAHWLFGLDLSKIDVVIHRESIIHSMVEYVDGSIIAQLSVPDMKIPIQYALTYPARAENRAHFIDFSKLKNLSFGLPDRKRFPALALAYQAAQKGGTAPAVLNAANEIAVHEFLEGKIGFLDMAVVVRSVLSKHAHRKSPTVAQILAADEWARVQAEIFCEEIVRK
jgi:1-deoxy-D-xylulose-5-phosphate reductoisomerase